MDLTSQNNNGGFAKLSYVYAEALGQEIKLTPNLQPPLAAAVKNEIGSFYNSAQKRMRERERERNEEQELELLAAKFQNEQAQTAAAIAKYMAESSKADPSVIGGASDGCNSSGTESYRHDFDNGKPCVKPNNARPSKGGNDGGKDGGA